VGKIGGKNFKVTLITYSVMKMKPI